MIETALGGPVSAALAADLQTWVQRHGIVVWLDTDNCYSTFVDSLAAAGSVPYKVRAYRGSHLALMLELEDAAGGSGKPQLVIHMPGDNEETIKTTPVYELYAVGVRYRKALETAVAEAAAARVRPEQITAFTGRPGLTLAAADTWLADLLAAEEGGIAALLRMLPPPALFDDFLAGGPIAARLAQPEDAAAVWERLAAWTGLPAKWRELTLPGTQAQPEDVAFAAASWALAVEYVHDLKRLPVSAQLAPAVTLPAGVVKTCSAIASHLRRAHTTFYRRTADETEALIDDEVKAAGAEDLGRIDTFRFEEEFVLAAALSALQARTWEPAAKWAAQRLDPKRENVSFWLQEDPARQPAWQLVEAAANVGLAAAAAGDHLKARSLAEAVDLYTRRGAQVDTAHRHLEQRRAALLYPQLPEFARLRACLDAARATWQRWAETWAQEFNALCRDQGFLPPPLLQQRMLFDQVVRPLAQGPGPAAVFVVDALRYEMGSELYRQLADTPATNVQLNARLAELPTVTEVGMNVLAPVLANGRLVPGNVHPEQDGSLGGFTTGEYRVFSPETRKRAMHDRVGGATAPWLTLDEVVNRDGAALKRTVAQARLVVVHSQEIDTAGENGMGPALFDGVLQKLRAAWRLLREAGVRRFVFTADHGFLLLNEGTAVTQAHGRKVDPMRRHVFSATAAGHPDEVRVALADLEYAGTQSYLLFPAGTAVFDTGKRSLSFVHGGNSLQERVIPVLTLVHRAAAGGSTLQYAVTAEAREGVAGVHCLEARVEIVAQQALDFGSPGEVELALRVAEGDEPKLGDVQVELVQARRARLAGSTIQATVGQPFEIFFRLSGRDDARVLVELYHSGAEVDVVPGGPETRFAVAAGRTTTAKPAAGTSPVASVRTPVQEYRTAADQAAGQQAAGQMLRWLEQLPEGGVREIFTHLATYGTVTEAETVTMMGDARGARRFALHFEEFAQLAPFGVRIEVVGGVKRYVREGSGQ